MRAGGLPVGAKKGKMRQLVQYCQLCRAPGAESIEHFMLDCPINSINRDTLVNDLKELWVVGRFSEWLRKDQNERVADIVMCEDDSNQVSVVKRYLRRMWLRREEMIKHLVMK